VLAVLLVLPSAVPELVQAELLLVKALVALVDLWSAFYCSNSFQAQCT
jgi:hypothetical protein